MDPQACLQRIFDAITDSANDEYCHAFLDLYEWLKRGGAPPTLAELPALRNGNERKRIAIATTSPYGETQWPQAIPNSTSK